MSYGCITHRSPGKKSGRRAHLES